MKKKIIIMFIVLFSLLAVSVCAESYGDILVYVLPSYAESQAQSFVSSVNSLGAFYEKQGCNIYIFVLSKGYGVDYQEYKLYSLESKIVITTSSSEYYTYKRKFNRNY